VWRPLKTPTSKRHQQRNLLTGDKKKSGVEYKSSFEKKEEDLPTYSKKKAKI
jgi:hypothetical protein